MSIRNGRHWTVDLRQVRPDHLQRYLYAAERIKKLLVESGALRFPTILDAGCGCGYGTAMLADAGFTVVGIDNDGDSIVFARENWEREHATFEIADLAHQVGPFDAVVCFEALEHVGHARDAVATFRQQAPWLIASVPNEDVLPFNGHQYHVRHYRPGEFEELLHGYCIGERRTQYTKAPGDVEPGFDGRTLVVTAKRTGEGNGAAGTRRPLVGRSMAAA